MPQPSSSDVLFSPLLTNLSIAYLQSEAKNFIAQQVFPNVPVEKQAGVYLTYNRSDWLRDEAQERAPGTASAGGGYRVDFNSNYYARVYAFHKDIDDQIRANARGYMDMDRDATAFVTRKLLIKRDVVWATQYFTTGIWTNDLAGVAGAPGANQFKQWSVAGSTPIEDIMNYVLAIAQLTGYRPNVIVMTPDVFTTLRNHAEVINRIVYTQRGFVTTDILASLWEVDKVLVPFGIRNTAQEGQADVYSWILGTKKLWLGYAAPSPGLLTPSAGYTFSWDGYLGAGAQGNRIKAFRMDELSSDRVEGEMAFDSKLISADLGAMFSNAV